jgi:hypothetical protein
MVGGAPLLRALFALAALARMSTPRNNILSIINGQGRQRTVARSSAVVSAQTNKGTNENP